MNRIQPIHVSDGLQRLHGNNATLAANNLGFISQQMNEIQMNCVTVISV